MIWWVNSNWILFFSFFTEQTGYVIVSTLQQPKLEHMDSARSDTERKLEIERVTAARLVRLAKEVYRADDFGPVRCCTAYLTDEGKNQLAAIATVLSVSETWNIIWWVCRNRILVLKYSWSWHSYTFFFAPHGSVQCRSTAALLLVVECRVVNDYQPWMNKFDDWSSWLSRVAHECRVSPRSLQWTDWSRFVRNGHWLFFFLLKNSMQKFWRIWSWSMSLSYPASELVSFFKFQKPWILRDGWIVPFTVKSCIKAALE